ncbi:hypothetical protein [Geoalkalibacter halelectricus]|uniref:hypothetical protein n=1 Tax=Geoalkalibacter halelectricus TaxID=2847045 RepID=UPI003D23A3B3
MFLVDLGMGLILEAAEGAWLEWLVLGLLAWFVLCHGVARFGGWTKLSGPYSLLGGFSGRRLFLQTILLERGVRYGNTMTLGVSHQGLYLAPLFVLRPGHPPLLIPWEEISVEDKKGFFGHTLEMRFSRVPGVTLTLGYATGKQLAEWAGEYWPGQRWEWSL